MEECPAFAHHLFDDQTGASAPNSRRRPYPQRKSMTCAALTAVARVTTAATMRTTTTAIACFACCSRFDLANARRTRRKRRAINRRRPPSTVDQLTSKYRLKLLLLLLKRRPEFNKCPLPAANQTPHPRLPSGGPEGRGIGLPAGEPSGTGPARNSFALAALVLLPGALPIDLWSSWPYSLPAADVTPPQRRQAVPCARASRRQRPARGGCSPSWPPWPHGLR